MVANSGNDDENNALYRNNGNSNNWINIKLIGTQSNKSAVGAKVRMKAVIDGQSIWQLREVSGLTGYCSQNSLNVNFGLGNALIIDSLLIEWPSGLVQVFENVDGNHFISIEEGNVLGIFDNGHKNQAPQNFHLYQNYPNPFNPSTSIRFELQNAGNVSGIIFNQSGQEIIELFSEYKEAGTHIVHWDGTNANGLKVSSGTYFYRLTVDGISRTMKMLFIK